MIELLAPPCGWFALAQFARSFQLLLVPLLPVQLALVVVPARRVPFETATIIAATMMSTRRVRMECVDGVTGAGKRGLNETAEVRQIFEGIVNENHLELRKIA